MRGECESKPTERGTRRSTWSYVVGGTLLGLFGRRWPQLEVIDPLAVTAELLVLPLVMVKQM